MNIFVLDSDTKKCAQYHCDKHVVKMIIETAQILSTVHYVIDKDRYKNLQEFIYKETHINHPAIKWASESRMNYIWLSELGLELCKEYTRRFNKVHKSEAVLFLLYKNVPDSGKYTITKFPRIFPIHYAHIENTIEAYREYYKEKVRKGIVCYTKTSIPEFIDALSLPKDEFELIKVKI